ncbi:MAG: PAS domain-containing sensor histidine kinase [Candidatus Obscuribacterales bacterium]|nr:PAS domain-containing sensor histidine kinase [Candidatus Obscuribacterales bacterium]
MSKDNEGEKIEQPEKGLKTSCSPFLGTYKSTSEKLLVLERALISACNGIVITDPYQRDNPIIYANPSFLQLTGYSREEVLGQNCRFLQGDDRRQEAVKDLRMAIDEERSITVVLKNYRKNGSLFWNELTVSPVHDESGRLINFIGIQNDISARMEADQRISEFYSMVSHELRTPLTSIRTSLGLLEEGTGGPLSRESYKLVEIAFRNTDRLVRLVNDILDFRKIQAGKLELHSEDLLAREAIEQVTNELESTAKEKQITFEISINFEKKFKADRDRIEQVLTNLVGNAIKFSPERSKVIIQADYGRDGFVCFTVRDSGPGIPKSEFNKLFQKFQQLDASDKRRNGGTGLGLAISKALVEMHGGSIGVDSKVGNGSAFWFEVPIESMSNS